MSNQKSGRTLQSLSELNWHKAMTLEQVKELASCGGMKYYLGQDFLKRLSGLSSKEREENKLKIAQHQEYFLVPKVDAVRYLRSMRPSLYEGSEEERHSLLEWLASLLGRSIFSGLSEEEMKEIKRNLLLARELNEEEGDWEDVGECITWKSVLKDAQENSFDAIWVTDSTPAAWGVKDFADVTSQIGQEDAFIVNKDRCHITVMSTSCFLENILGCKIDDTPKRSTHVIF